MKKYKLTNNKIHAAFGPALHQIQAIRDIGNFCVSGELGGFIEKESNLSHAGTCWVMKDAQIFGNARVFGNSLVYGNAHVFGGAQVGVDARVYGNAQVSGSARVLGDARVFGNACVLGDAHVSENARVKDNEHVRFIAYTDLAKDKKASIAAQTGIRVADSGVFYAYKHVRDDLSSMLDPNFFYKLNKRIEVKDPDLSNEPCASGIHVSTADYWNFRDGNKIIICKCHIDDVITVQEGKIRMRAVKPIDVVSHCVF